MRTFCHISEFDALGYDLLPSMMLMSEKLVVWAPAGTHLLDLNRDYKTFLHPEDLLNLIDEGYIQVIAREDWLTDIEYRNSHRWPLAKWNNPFDNELKLWSIQDSAKPLENRRVIIDKPEEGFNKADEFLANPIKTKTINVLAARIENHELPKGTLEKFNGKNKDEQIRLALRDIFNHLDARDSGFCNSSFEPDEWADFIYEIVGVKTKSFEDTAEIGPDKIYEILGELKRFQNVNSFKDLKLLLKFRDKVKSELVEMSKSTLSIESIMDSSIVNGIKIPTWFESLRPKTADVISLGFILGSVVTLGTSFLDYFMLVAGTGTEVFGRDTMGKRIFEKVNLLTVEPSKYKTPFILAFGRGSVTYKEAKQLYSKIIEK